jgi:hypothetical protein
VPVVEVQHDRHVVVVQDVDVVVQVIRVTWSTMILSSLHRV